MCIRWLPFLSAAFALIVFIERAILPLHAQLPTIELHTLSRSGGQIGSTFDVHVQAGEWTEEVDHIYFSHPGIQGQIQEPEAAGPSKASGRFRVSIGNDVPTGIYDVRIQGRFGLSNARAFMVTQEPWSVGNAQATTSSDPPIAVDSYIQDEALARQAKGYALQLQAGQRVRIRCFTASIDSRARVLMSLASPHQRHAGQSDAIDGQDASIEFTASQSGTHRLMISDHLYRGGPEFRYVIHVSTSNVESDQANADRTLVDEWRLNMAGLRAERPIEIAVENTRLDSMPAISKVLLPSAATFRMPTADLPITVHDESAFPDQQSCLITFPGLVVGRFDSNEDRDAFDVALEAKSEVIFEVASERLGELTDPQLLLYRIDQPQAGEAKQTIAATGDDMANVAASDVRLASRDALIRFTAPESGTYRLVIRDQQRSDRRRNRHRYALELRKPVPDFTAITYLSYPTRDPTKAEPLAPTLIRDSTLAVSVAIYRHDGWNGPVTIKAENLPKGVTASELVIAADQSNGQLILSATPDAVANASGVRILATAQLGDKEVTHRAIPVEITWGPTGTQKVPVARLASHHLFTVEDRDRMPLRIQLDSPDALTIAQGSSVKIPIKLHRQENLKQPVTIRMRNVPAKAKASELTINGDKDSGEIELTVSKETPFGEYSCWAQCESKISFQPNPQALEREQKWLAELQSKKSQVSAEEAATIEKSIAAQQEKIKQLQESTKAREFTVQLPSTAVRLRIVDKL